MSVTIVSAVAKAAPTAKTESSAAPDQGSAAVDFASLLSDQLAPPPTPAVVPGNDSANETPEADAAATSDDTAALLAALGIVAAPAAPAPAQSAAADTLTADKTAAVAAPALAAQAAPQLAAKGLPAAAATATPPAANPDPAAMAAEEPAIIAASAAKAAPEKAEIVRSLAEPAAPAPAAFAINAPAAAAVAGQRETATSVPTSVRDPHWAGDFAQKIVWLATNDRQAAQLTLNPPQMGPIEISMSLEKGHASASFFSANAEVREAIETALPRLREMFASAGIELGQANVSAESFKQAQANEYSGQRESRGRGDNAILVAGSAAALPASAFGGARGMVDIFA